MPTGKGKLTGEHRGTVDDADEPEKPPKPQANQRTLETPRKPNPTQGSRFASTPTAHRRKDAHLFLAISGTALEVPTVGARAEAGAVTAEEEGGADLKGRAPAATSLDPPRRNDSFAAASPKPMPDPPPSTSEKAPKHLICHCTAPSHVPSPASSTETEQSAKICHRRQLDAVEKRAKA